MLRRLLVLMVLVSLALCGVAQGKPAAAKRCAKGQVRLTAHSPCVKARATKATTMPSSFLRDARVRTLAGTTLYAKARKARAAMVAQGVARAAAASAADGAWEEVEIGGRPGRKRTTVDESDAGGTQRRAVSAESELTLAGGGATATLSVTEKHTLVAVSCPDADGVATATVEDTHVERTTARRGGQSGFTEARMTRRAKVRVQVGDDAEIVSAGYTGTVDFENRATGEPTSRYVMTWDRAAALPDGPKADLAGALRADPSAFFAGTYRGPKGERFTAAESEALLGLRYNAQGLIEDDLRGVLLTMKHYWQEDGRCVELEVAPKAVVLANGQEATLNATARVLADGSPMNGAMTVTPMDGAVDDAHPRMVNGGPVPVRFTMGGARDKTSVLLTVVSRRGKAVEAVEVTRPHGWNVTFTATGSYDQTREHGGDVDVTRTSLKWTSQFTNVFFDGGAFNPIGQTDMTGTTMATHGNLGTGTYACTGVPYPPGGTIVPTPGADGSVALTITPFSGVEVDQETEQCHREGYGGDYGHVIGIEHPEPYVAHVTVTREMLAQSEFVVPVTFGSGFPPNCGETDWLKCSESGTMVGGVRFTRVS